MGCCKIFLLVFVLPFLIFSAMLSQDSGRKLYIGSLMKLKRDVLLPTIKETDGVTAAHPTLGFAFKLATWPYVIAILAKYTSDFRRVMFFECMELSGGYGVEYGPWANGLAQFSHAAVVADQLSATQQRGPFFGGLTVGGPECDVPFECMSGWQLTTSTDDPKHSRVRQILHDAVEGLTVDPHAKRDLLLPPGLTDLDQADKDVLANIVGMNLWSRMFGLNQWSATLEALFTEYGAKGALCAVGIYKGDKLRVAEIVNEVGAAIEKTQVGQAILRMSTEGSTPLDPAKVINMVAFGFLFAGVGGSSHLTASSVARLRSDPALYVPMFKKNPQNFIVEQARIDPPVTSYNSLLQETVDATIMGKPMKLLKGTNKQNFIATANRDPAVFENGDIFNPDRANLDKVLSWNGPEDLVGLGKAPRGCPGHDIAQVVAKQVIRHFLPTQSKTGGSHAEL